MAKEKMVCRVCNNCGQEWRFDEGLARVQKVAAWSDFRNLTVASLLAPRMMEVDRCPSCGSIRDFTEETSLRRRGGERRVTKPPDFFLPPP